MNVYIKQLASAARESCAEKRIIVEPQYKLNYNTIKKIITYFKGELKKFDSEDEMRGSYPSCRGNSFMKKTSEDTFMIGYVNFVVMDILHELGHVFLELDTMRIGDIRSCNDIDGGINEIGAAKFARAFLFPSPLFERTVINHSISGSCDVQAVAKIFGTDSLQIISYGRESYLWE